MSPLNSFRSEPAIRRPAIMLVVLLAIVILGELLLTNAFSSIGTSGFPGWLPQVGSAGSTVLFYNLLMDVLKYVFVPLTAIWLSYAYGRHQSSSAV